MRNTDEVSGQGCYGWREVRRNSSSMYQHPSGRPAVTRSTTASPECILLTSTTSPGWRGAARVLSSKRTHLARWGPPRVPVTITSGSSTAIIVRRSSRADQSGSMGRSLVTDSGPPPAGLRVHPPSAGLRRCSRSCSPGGGWRIRAPGGAVSGKYNWSSQAAPVTGLALQSRVHRRRSASPAIYVTGIFDSVG